MIIGRASVLSAKSHWQAPNGTYWCYEKNSVGYHWRWSSLVVTQCQQMPVLASVGIFHDFRSSVWTGDLLQILPLYWVTFGLELNLSHIFDTTNTPVFLMIFSQTSFFFRFLDYKTFFRKPMDHSVKTMYCFILQSFVKVKIKLNWNK